MEAMVESAPVFRGAVVIVADPGADAWWRGSILSRRDLKVYPARDYATALELLGKVSCRLLVVEERPGGDLQALLDKVRTAFAKPPFRMILIGPSMAPAQPKPPVTRVLAAKPPIEAFNECLADEMNLLPRKSKRHLVRIQMAFDTQAGARLGVAVTLDLSPHGMKIETGIPLEVGQQCYCTFSGIKELADVVVPGTVLREDVQSAHGNLRCFGIRFDDAAARERKILERYLSQRF